VRGSPSAEGFTGTLSLEDGERLMRVAADVWSVTALDDVRRSHAAQSDEDAALRFLDGWEQIWDRLSHHGAFVLRLARRLGDDGLEAGLAQAAGVSEVSLISFRKLASREGGLLPLVECRLRDFETAWPVMRARLQRDRERLGRGEIPSAFTDGDPRTLMCVSGVLMIVAGAGLAVFGAEAAAGFCLVAGVAMGASAC
jgi:hypothetical protein